MRAVEARIRFCRLYSVRRSVAECRLDTPFGLRITLFDCDAEIGSHFLLRSTAQYKIYVYTRSLSNSPMRKAAHTHTCTAADHVHKVAHSHIYIQDAFQAVARKSSRVTVAKRARLRARASNGEVTEVIIYAPLKAQRLECDVADSKCAEGARTRCATSVAVVCIAP